jgi:hypothetical protein
MNGFRLFSLFRPKKLDKWAVKRKFRDDLNNLLRRYRDLLSDADFAEVFESEADLIRQSDAMSVAKKHSWHPSPDFEIAPRPGAFERFVDLIRT